MKFWTPRCGRCGSEKVSETWVDIKGKSYRLCDQCFSDYLKIDVMDNGQRVSFIKGKLPTGFWERMKLRAGRKRRRK